MKTSHTARTTVLSLALLALGAVSLQAAISFDITSSNSNSDPDAPASWFSVTLAVNPGNTAATFSISNLVAAGNGTKISSIWLGTATSTTNNFLSIFSSGTGSLGGTGTFNYSLVEGYQNLGGVSFGAGVTGVNATGNDASTLNPGETLNITYSLINPGVDAATTEQSLRDAFSSNPQKLGIAFHVQSIGTGGFSEKYEATPSPDPGNGGNVPDGGTTALSLGIALLGLGSMRRYLSKKA